MVCLLNYLKYFLYDGQYDTLYHKMVAYITYLLLQLCRFCVIMVGVGSKSVVDKLSSANAEVNK